MVRAMHHISRCHLRGEELRSKSRLPGRSLLPSSALEHVAALRPSRTFDRSAHQNFRTDSRDPPDLGANYPDAFRSLRPGRKAGFPLVGLSKDRPSIVSIAESDSRKRSNSASPRGLGSHCCGPASFGMGTPIPIQRAVFVVSHHLDGLLLRDLAALLHAASDRGVHRVSSCRETGFPAVHLLPFEAFPPPTATEAGTNPRIRGLASPFRPFPAVTFTANLASPPFLSSDSGRGCPHSRPDELGPRGLAPSSGPLRVRAFPLARTRCSLGLGRLARPRLPPVPSPRTGGAVRKTTRTNCRHHVKDHSHE